MTAVAESSRTYVVMEGQNALCEIRLPALPFRGGTIVVKGEQFAIARAGLFWSEFRLVRSGQTLARAEASPSWRIMHGDDILTVWPTSEINFDGPAPWELPQWGLCRGEEVLGSIRLEWKLLGRRARQATVRTYVGLDLSVWLFVLWLILFRERDPFWSE
jgi:hypothetical protein